MPYATFKPGDIVTVQPWTHNFWMYTMHHAKAQFVVKEVIDSPRPCCAGHPNQLICTDGNLYSASWFDPLITEHGPMCAGHSEEDDFYGLLLEDDDGDIL